MSLGTIKGQSTLVRSGSKVLLIQGETPEVGKGVRAALGHGLPAPFAGRSLDSLSALRCILYLCGQLRGHQRWQHCVGQVTQTSGAL